MDLKLVQTSKCCSGEQRVYSHHSKVLDCEMKCGVYVPPVALVAKCPVLYFLSGLTCTTDNFIQKSGMQRFAAQHGIIVVNPDTSPRNVNIPGEDDSYDIGSGASFYVDAIREPWSKHYRMYSYVTKELIEVINSNFNVFPNKMSIFGHSMGGHGALICALRNPHLYKSVSAFAPICNPVESAIAQKAYSAYLGSDRTEWKQWDATCLAEKYAGDCLELFVDQGECDEFLEKNELLPENLVKVSEGNDNIRMVYKKRKGYDHSYFYVATFVEEHLAYHAKMLNC